MPTASAVQPSPPKTAEDRRWRLVNRTMRLHDHKPHALIETLHVVQETFGFLDLDALRHVAEALKVPLSRVYAVATFYHFFTLKPPGEHTCVICMGTACYIGGASGILESIQEAHGIAPGETTPDNRLSLVTARCLGSCGLAPAGVFDGEVAGKLKPGTVLEKLGRWTRHDDDA
ncbi:MAG: bidirectional hydrogenase complex protein HoxE [Desulfobacterales bacterium]